MLNTLENKRSALLTIIALALVTRLFFLNYPDQVVFDEVHWGRFFTAYTHSHENFFDVHPPHGKLIVAAVAVLTGYDGQQDFSKIGLPYDHASSIALRLPSALMGALIPIISFLLLMELGVSVSGAFLAAFLLLFDNALVLQSRIMGLYPMLLLAVVASLYFYTLAERRAKWLWMAGVSAGFAVGFQFTGILALGILFLYEAQRVFLRQESTVKEGFVRLFKVSSIALLVYLIGWILHLNLLTKPGPGDAFYRNTGQFLVDFVSLHEHMYRASATLVTPHPEASPFWSWPLMKTPIYYWKGNNKSLYFVGNPVFWWGISALFLIGLFLSLRRKQLGFSSTAFFLFAAYLLAFVPLIFMKRVLFMYHYLTPLTFSLLFVAVVFDREAERYKWLVIGIGLVGFLWLSPVTFGYSVPDFWWKSFPWKLWH